MRVIDMLGHTITGCDLSNGVLIPAKFVRKDADPIDNKTKWAWADDDYEEVQVYIPNHIKTVREQIAELKAKLQQTDYYILKLVEGALAPGECTEIIAQRAKWRKEINELEKEAE